ncbi:MAG: polyhydroxyalkanoic acid synthase [Caulobacteraceae bacterium]|jgi:putative polyhydroxyalkanoate system protein|nr:polyhydroxyalkanoic acid synthase [Caulobacteraceae bacterium]
MSKPLSISVPHSHGKDEARRRIEIGVEKALQKMTEATKVEVQRHWEGDRLFASAEALGQKIHATADVGEDAIEVLVHLPMMLSMMAGKVQERVLKEGRRILG